MISNMDSKVWKAKAASNVDSVFITLVHQEFMEGSKVPVVTMWGCFNLYY